MSNAITVYTIELSQDKNGNEFREFMLNEIFPAIYKGATRGGVITGLVLLQGNTTGRNHEYLWLVYGRGLIHGGAARGQIETIEAFGAQVSPIQDFVESGRWFAGDELGQELLLDKDC